MKIFYQSKFASIITFLSSYKTITLGIWTFTEKPSLTQYEIDHEQTHVYEYEDCFLLGIGLSCIFSIIFLLTGQFQIWKWCLLMVCPILLFYVVYGIEFLVKLLLTRHVLKAYQNISLEKYAYSITSVPEYAYHHYEWVKYIFTL